MSNFKPFKEHKKLTKAKLPKGCLGYADELTDAEKVNKHVDGASGLVFETEADYLAHTSPVTGHKPSEVAHQDALTGGRFSRQSAKALERGEARKNE